MAASDLSEVIRRALHDFERFGARAALIGGLAVSLRTQPRMTKDVDFSVAVSSDQEAEQLVSSFLGAGYRHGAILEHETGRLATVRLFAPDSQGTEPDLDLLFSSCGIENEIVAAATTVQFPGIGSIAAARIGHLIAMKILAESDTRERDRADLHALIAAAPKRELDLAKNGCELIQERGFARGKDLAAALSGFMKRWKS